jgi:predicted flap endonuclease-1-like 5' DNA nuclease
MAFLVIETFVLMAVFVALGAGIGILLRQIVDARAPLVADAEGVLAPDTPPLPAGHVEDAAASGDDGIIDAEKAAGADQVGVQPQALPGPRDGVADDLKRIRGVGRQNETRLNALGIYHLDQIADWTPDEARWVSAYISFPGRVEREDWPGQARAILAEE